VIEECAGIVPRPVEGTVMQRCKNGEKDMSAAGKLRTPTKADMENAERWLNEALYNLSKNEYHRVKLLCKQVIRALRRKENEGHND